MENAPEYSEPIKHLQSTVNAKCQGTCYLAFTNRQSVSHLKKLTAIFPKEKPSALLIQQSIQQLNLSFSLVKRLCREMTQLASTLPEYSTAMGIYGVGKTYSQLTTKIGDVSRFAHEEMRTAFARIDPSVNESGQHKSKSNRTSTVRSAKLRKTLFQIITTLYRMSQKTIPYIVFWAKNNPTESLTMSTWQPERISSSASTMAKSKNTCVT